MTEAEWLTSDDPAAMLAAVTAQALPADRNAPYAPVVRPLASARKLRLFATACCRQVWDGTPCPRCSGNGTVRCDRNGNPDTFGDRDRICPAGCHSGRRGGLTDPRSRRAVVVAEKYADGLATEEELADAQHQAYYLDPMPGVEGSPERYAAYMVANICSNDPAHFVQPNYAHWPREAGVSLATQAALLRDIFGSPWRPVCLRKSEMAKAERSGKIAVRKAEPNPLPGALFPLGGGPIDSLPYHLFDDVTLLTWHDAVIPKIARRMYGVRTCEVCDGRGTHCSGPCHGKGIYTTRSDFTDMPLLADMLADAGCEDDAILSHCREDGKCNAWCHLDGNDAQCRSCGGSGRLPNWVGHVRGCWVIDLLLNKE